MSQNYLYTVINTAYQLAHSKKGGAFKFLADGHLDTEKTEKFAAFQLDNSDLHNIKLFEEQIMPKIKLNGVMCGTDLKKEATEISMGGFGILFKFICTANGKKFSMKISLPKNIKNKSDWELYKNEHDILNMFGNKEEDSTRGILLPRYYGYIDLTGLDKQEVIYTPSLFDSDFEIPTDFIFPSRIMIFFQEWLDGDLNTPLHFDQPIDVYYMIFGLLKSLEIITKAGYVHSDIKGGNIMKKDLSDIIVEESQYFTRFQDKNRLLYKIIDLGAVAKEGEKIKSYSDNYLSPELSQRIEQKMELSKKFNSLIASGSSREVLQKTLGELNAIPLAICVASQDIYALGFAMIEILGLASNNSTKRGVHWLTVEDVSSIKNWTDIIEKVFTIDFTGDNFVKDHSLYESLNKTILTKCKQVLLSMIAPVAERPTLEQLLTTITIDNKMFTELWNSTYMTRMVDYD